MFYLVTAAIVMHNMMVHERIAFDERESESFYDIGDEQLDVSITEHDNDDENSEEGSSVSVQNVVGNFDMSNVKDSTMKYKFIQKRWKKLYSEENSLRLHDAVKKYVFKKHCSNDGSLDMQWWMMTIL